MAAVAIITFWDIRLKIYRFPNFNTVFQLVLINFFKSELFSCLPKLTKMFTLFVHLSFVKLCNRSIGDHNILGEIRSGIRAMPILCRSSQLKTHSVFSSYSMSWIVLRVAKTGNSFKSLEIKHFFCQKVLQKNLVLENMIFFVNKMSSFNDVE